MFLCSIQISHRTWRSRMKSWSALQEQTLITCEFSNTAESDFRSTLNPNHRQSEAQLLPPRSNYKQTSPAAHLILHSHVTIDFIYMRMNILLLFWKLAYSEFDSARGLRGFYGTCNMQLPIPVTWWSEWEKAPKGWNGIIGMWQPFCTVSF